MLKPGESFLSEQFQTFYNEVIRLKRQVVQGDWVFEGEADWGEEDEASAPTAVWQTLLTLLEQQSLGARRSGGDFAAEIYRQAQYAMAALADEIFLNLDWAGAEAWSGNLLETRLFSSHRAGEEIFRRIDELLTRRDPVYLDLGRIYLQVLALGFQGRFRGSAEGEAHLASYRRRLFHFLANRDPEFEQGSSHLFPEAYASTLDHGTPTRMPYLRNWLLAIGVVLLLWTVASYPVWRSLSAGFADTIQKILES